MKYSFVYNTIIGDLHIFEDSPYITRINFGRLDDPLYKEEETDTIKKAHLEIEEYLRGERKVFTIPYKLYGTDFQKKVWEELVKIPYGKTATYKQVAIGIDNEKAVRAVGNANNKNPLSLIIP